MAKNGLPAVFSWISSASAVARSGSQRRVSVINCARSSPARGARTISCTGASAFRIASSLRIRGWEELTSLFRYAPINIRCRTSDWHRRSSIKSRVAESSHCKSSRNKASGCSGLANTPINRRKTSWNRRWASCCRRSGTGGGSPTMSCNSGTRFTMSFPFGPSASSNASRHSLNSLSFLLKRGRIRL